MVIDNNAMDKEIDFSKYISDTPGTGKGIGFKLIPFVEAISFIFNKCITGIPLSQHL